MKPDKLKTAGLLMFISGIINLVTAGLTALTILFVILHATIMIGALSMTPLEETGGAPFPIWILFIVYAFMSIMIITYSSFFFVVGMLEIKNGRKLRADERTLEKAPITVAILGIICFVFGNQLSGILEIIAVVLMSDGECSAYFNKTPSQKSGTTE